MTTLVAIPVQIDVTDEASVAAAAKRSQNTTVLVNNAGIGIVQDAVLASNTIELSRHLMDTNTYGIVRSTGVCSDPGGQWR